MPSSNTPDRQSRLVWLLLAIVGAILCIVGWYRWAAWRLVAGKHWRAGQQRKARGHLSAPAGSIARLKPSRYIGSSQP